MKYISHITSLFIGMLIFANGAMACSIEAPTSYTYKIDNYVFVMLIEDCKKITHEKVMTATEATEFEAMSKQEQKKYISKLSTSKRSCSVIFSYNLSDQSEDKVLTYTKATLVDFTSKSGVIYKYPGLYKDDGSNIPEWTVDWYEDSARFFIVNNGRNLIRLRSTSYENGLALAFYDRGVLTKEYKVKELIRDVDNITGELDDCFGGTWAKNTKVGKNNTILIETKNNEEYVFNTISGEILESKLSTNNEILAKVVLINNENILLTKFKACGGFATVQLLQGNNDSIYGPQ